MMMDREIGQFYACHCKVLSYLETLVGHVMFQKWLTAATFESSEPLHLLRLNGHVCTIPT